MTLETVMLELPSTVLERAQQAADALHRPLNDVLRDTLQAALPDMGEVPPDMQDTLAHMTWMPDQDLWAIARRVMEDAAQARLWALKRRPARAQLDGGGASKN